MCLSSFQSYLGADPTCRAPGTELVPDDFLWVQQWNFGANNGQSFGQVDQQIMMGGLPPMPWKKPYEQMFLTVSMPRITYAEVDVPYQEQVMEQQAQTIQGQTTYVLVPKYEIERRPREVTKTVMVTQTTTEIVYDEIRKPIYVHKTKKVRIPRTSEVEVVQVTYQQVMEHPASGESEIYAKQTSTAGMIFKMAVSDGKVIKIVTEKGDLLQPFSYICIPVGLELAEATFVINMPEKIDTLLCKFTKLGSFEQPSILVMFACSGLPSVHQLVERFRACE